MTMKLEFCERSLETGGIMNNGFESGQKLSAQISIITENDVYDYLEVELFSNEQTTN